MDRTSHRLGTRKMLLDRIAQPNSSRKHVRGLHLSQKKGKLVAVDAICTQAGIAEVFHEARCLGNETIAQSTPEPSIEVNETVEVCVDEVNPIVSGKNSVQVFSKVVAVRQSSQ